jgi:3',5'-cyclic AMP phosphodiesterase CpdA
VRILHLTDPHLSSLAGTRLRTLRGKRWLGYLSWWRRRRFDFDASLRGALADAVRGDRPDLVAVTGDLVHIALPGEIAAARAWLDELAAIAPVVVVPGNHDCYAADAWSALQAQWSPYLGTRNATFPSITPVGDVTVIGLSSAGPEPWWSAGGALGASQLAALAQALERSAGTFRCVLLHHPPLPGMSGWRKGLRDAPALASHLARHEVELVLHGHVHRNQWRVAGDMRVVATAPAFSTVASRPASYRLFDIADTGVTWQVRMQLKTLATGRTYVAGAGEEWSRPRRAAPEAAALTPRG